MPITAGLDVGGAHLKVALVDGGRVLDVAQFLCPLWQGLDKLDAALAEAQPMLARASRHAVTMTGELSDLFPDRTTGVLTLLGRVEHAFGGGTRIWTGRKGLGTLVDARGNPADVGSTNFLATGTLIGRHHRDALLIDFGSTTADILAVRDGQPDPGGLTDAIRQTTGELVYTGTTRTAVMGVTNRVPFKGHWVTLAREYLATMADVRRVLGFDLSAIDVHATADGKGKSLEESVARLARMFGRDAGEGTLTDWQAAARFIREEQLRSLDDGIHQVLSAHTLPASAPVIVAGIGAADAAAVGVRHERPVVSFAAVVATDGPLAVWVEACAPAVAVALLSE